MERSRRRLKSGHMGQHCSEKARNDDGKRFATRAGQLGPVSDCNMHEDESSLTRLVEPSALDVDEGALRGLRRCEPKQADLNKTRRKTTSVKEKANRFFQARGV